MSIDRSTTAVALVRSNFFGKDFNTIRQEIIDTMTALTDAETTSNLVASDLGIMIIEAMAFAMSTLSWYGDRQAGETTLDINDGARIRANAVAIARQVGYKPFGAVPPVVELSVLLGTPTALTPAPIQFTIPRGTKLVEVSGLPWETAEDLTFNAGQDGSGVPALTNPIKNVLARQGSSSEEVFTSDGLANQKFSLEAVPETDSIANGTVEARVDSVLWEEVTLLEPRSDNIFEVELGRNPPFVRFGDSIFGAIPEVDVEVRITYFTTRGPDGAVASSTITGFVSPIVAGTTTLTTTVTHTDSSTAGSFRETLKSIKRNAPLIFQTGQRAVTILDLDGLINSFVDSTFGAVARGRATTPRSAEADARLQTHLTILRNSGGFSTAEIDDLERYWNKVVSSECRANIVMAQIMAEDSIGRYVATSVGLARALETYLDTLAESTVKTWAVDGTVNLFSVDMQAQIKVVTARDTQVLRASIITEVDQIIQTFLLKRDFGVSLQIGDLYALIEAVDAVSYVNLKISKVTNQSLDVTTARVDEFGNLPVSDYEVISLGALPAVTVIES